MRAALLKHSWLQRVLEVETIDGRFVVEYDGRGIGYEAVWVNDERVAAPASWSWFVPRIEFRLGTESAAVEVRVSPWLAIRSFCLVCGDQVLYAEGTWGPVAPNGRHS